jgi:CRP-like cAMP-binding protein
VLRNGAALIHQGQVGDGLWLVGSGALRSSMITADGRDLTLEVLGPGDLAGEPEGVASATTLRALRRTRLRPAEPRAAADLLAARAHRAAALAADLAWLGVRERLLRRLEDLAERFGTPSEGGTLILLPLTQDDLAALAGTTRESVSRTMGALTRDGRIRVAGRGRYVIRSDLRVIAGTAT